MTTQYTSLLGFALPVTGELNGTWGDVVNNSITTLVEDSIAATATQSVTSGDWTLTTTGSGAANQARCAILVPTGSPGVSRNIIAPSLSKAYIVVNQSDAAVVLKGAATTGVTIAAGIKALCVWNGSDFVQVGDAGSVTSVTGTSPVASSGGTTPAISLASGYGDTQNPYASKTANYLLAAPNGSAGVPTFRAMVAADLPTVTVAKGGTGATSLTANYVLLGNGTSALQEVAPGTSGNVLTSNGTTWVSQAAGGGLTNWTDGVNTSSPNATIPVVSLTATNAATNVDASIIPKGTGALLAAVPDGTTAGGNKRGTYAVDLQTYPRSANTQVASGTAAVIVGGRFNQASASYSFIGGGSNNRATGGGTSVVAGGDGNLASNLNSALCGGTSNTSSGANAFIGGGSTCSATTTGAAVLGGYGNIASGTFSSVHGGQSNTASANNAAVVGGQSNSASDEGSTVLNGYLNTVNNAYSLVGGAFSTASGTTSVAIGSGNTSSGGYSAALGGDHNLANGTNSAVIGGSYGTAWSVWGRTVLPASATPIAGAAGVSQTSLLVVGRETTNNTPTTATSSGSATGSATNQLFISTSSAYSIRGTAVSFCNTTGDAKEWSFTCLLKRTSGGTTSIVGSPSVTSTFADAGAASWSLAIAADTGNNALAVTVTGDVSNTIRTTCRLDTIEVKF